MPYGIAVTTSEGELVRSIWGQDGVEHIHAENNIIWFDPRHGKSILTAIAEESPEDAEPDVKRRLIERIAGLCGKSLLEDQPVPVALDEKTSHIEEEDANKETPFADENE